MKYYLKKIKTKISKSVDQIIKNIPQSSSKQQLLIHLDYPRKNHCHTMADANFLVDQHLRLTKKQ